MPDSWQQIDDDGVMMDWTSADTIKMCDLWHPLEAIRRAINERVSVLPVNLGITQLSPILRLEMWQSACDRIVNKLCEISPEFIDTRAWVDGVEDVTQLPSYGWWYNCVNQSGWPTWPQTYDFLDVGFGRAYVAPTKLDDLNGEWLVGIRNCVNLFNCVNYFPSVKARVSEGSGQGDAGNYYREEGLLPTERLPRGGISHKWEPTLGEFSDAAGGNLACVCGIKVSAHINDPISYYGGHLVGIEDGSWVDGAPFYTRSFWNLTWRNYKCIAQYNDTPPAAPFDSTVKRVVHRSSSDYAYGPSEYRYQFQIDPMTVDDWSTCEQNIPASAVIPFSDIVPTPINDLPPLEPDDMCPTINIVDQEYYGYVKSGYGIGWVESGRSPASVRNYSMINLTYAAYRKFHGFKFRDW